MSKLLSTGALAALLCSAASGAMAVGYIFAGESNGVDAVAHPIGYNGVGGNINVTVGIDQTSVFAADMAISVQNVVNTFNALVPTVNNFSFGQIANNEADFESVLLHEMGHSLGIAHFNLASESGIGSPGNRGTKTTDGADNTFNVGPGVDNVYGTADDVRGDDVNLIYFNAANNPFDVNLGVVDSTTYSRDVADLPIGELFPVIASREAAAALGYGDTEAVMVQGSYFGEIQRSLAAQDVASVLYAQSGVDSIAGTADDYTVSLEFVGEQAAADILIDFDNSQTGFAVSQSGGAFIPGSGGQDVRITNNNIYFNDGFNWFFNDVSNSPAPVPLPASMVGLIFGLAGFGVMKRRKAAKSAERA